MGSVLQYLHPSLWGDMLHASVNDLGRAEFWADESVVVLRTGSDACHQRTKDDG